MAHIFADALQNRRLKNFAKITGNHLHWSFFLRDSNTGMGFPVKFVKILKEPFLKNTSVAGSALMKLPLKAVCQKIQNK